MTKKFSILPILFLGAFLMFAPSCGETDPCKDKEGQCGNGSCFEGECVCDQGYELGTSGSCDTEWSAKFTGSFLGFDNVTASTAGTTLGKYTLTKPAVITRLSATTIRITNFGGFDSYIDATIESQANTSKIKIDFRDPGQRSFTGGGTISGNTLTGNYVVKFSDNTTDTATFEYKK